MIAALETSQANLAVGGSWIEPFENMSFFPTMTLEMLRIGMETDMTTMIDKILEFLEEDIEITIARITKVLPEVGNIIMGVILVGFVLIILKPIMEVYMGTFLFDAYGV
ncbi:MAG: type II secretion system F family protein [Clostridia bacterium]|nr:type II secretion system F family protein [Clostridia bacterium]